MYPKNIKRQELSYVSDRLDHDHNSDSFTLKWDFEMQQKSKYFQSNQIWIPSQTVQKSFALISIRNH